MEEAKSAVASDKRICGREVSGQVDDFLSHTSLLNLGILGNMKHNSRSITETPKCDNQDCRLNLKSLEKK